VKANPGSKVHLSINFSCIQMSFTAFVLCILVLFKFKTEGQTTEKLTAKLQNSDRIAAYPGLA